MADPSEPGRLTDLIVVTAGATLAAFALGLTGPLIAVLLVQSGYGALEIGGIGACQSFAVLPLVPYLPALFAKFGPRRLISLAFLVACASVLLLIPISAGFGWFPIRALFGAAVLVGFVGADTWVTQAPPTFRRARVVSLYVMATTAGLASGPQLIGPLLQAGPALFFIAAGTLGIGGLLIAGFARSEPAMIEAAPGPRLRTFLKSLDAMSPVFAFGFITAACIVLMPFYGMTRGLPEAQSVHLVSAMIAGTVLTQPVLGWLTDKLGRIKVLAAVAVGIPIATALFALLFEFGPARWTFIVLAGALIGALWMISMTLLGDRNRGRELAGAMTTYLMVFALGQLLGPIAVGAAISKFGGEALPALIGFMGLVSIVPILLLPRIASSQSSFRTL